MSYFRQPKTAQIRRQYAQIFDDAEVIEPLRIRVRGRRRPAALWFAHDDFPCAITRIWKSYRRHQWRAP